MQPIEFADKYLGEYQIKDDEINPKHCPFCGPNKKTSNQYKFYLNKNEGTYVCHRENKCGAKGSFNDLLKHFNLKGDGNQNTEKKYKKPKVKTVELSKKVKDYISKRGISRKVLNNHNVKEKNGNIAFEYYHNKQLVLVKYRNLRKGDNKKYWQEGGGKPVLWEIDKIDTDKSVIITEGEFDKLALHQSGFDNVVSVPFGSNNFKWVDFCWDKLEKIDEIIIWPDNDDAGLKMKNELLKRLGEWRCKVVKSRYPDVNVHLHKKGEQSVKKAVKNAEEIPVKRLLQLHEIEEFDPTKIESIKSNIPLINKYLGGYMMGMVSIWTGTNGSGKSTFLNYESINSISQGFPTAIATGELPHWLTRYWLELQAAGPYHIESKMDEVREELSFYVPKENKQKIRTWAKKKLFIYDSFDSLKVNDIIETFTGAAMRYGVKNFIVDNLMIVNYEGSQKYKYDKQSEFVRRMKDFARKYEAHVHIVAHPRKPKGDVITKEDIAGLYEITNQADNVLALHRLDDKKRKALGIKEQDAESAASVFKGRIYGEQGYIIPLGFDKTCKRFAQYSVEDYDKKFGWEDY